MWVTTRIKQLYRFGLWNASGRSGPVPSPLFPVPSVKRLRLHAGWPLLAYLALSLLLTWPLVAQLGVRLPGLGDALLQTWVLAWNAHILRTDPAAYWQSPLFYPYPDTAAYNDQHLVQSLVGAPLIWATGNPVLAYNVLVLLSFALTGWAVYLLALDLAAEAAPSAPPAALAWGAFVAGCAVTFSAYRMAHIEQLNLLQTAWLIFALFALRRLLRPLDARGGRWRDALLLGLCAGLQVATAVYYGFFAGAVLGAYVLLWAGWSLWRRVRFAAPLPWAVLPRLGVAGLLAALIGVPLLLPYLGLYRTLGIVRSPAELENWSAPLRAYVSVPATNWLYAPLGEAVVDSGEMVLFPGLALTGLGLLALGMGVNDRRRGVAGMGDRLFLGLLAGAAMLLSFGTALRLVRYGEPLPLPMPYPLLYSYVPGFGSLRVPARWGWLVTLALALLAAVSLARLLARLRAPWRHLLGAAAVGLILIEQVAFPLPLSQPVLGAVPPIYSWLGMPAQADLTTVIELPVGATPRGAELERIIWRHFYSLEHWKRLPIAYGGLIPFGTVELLRRLQSLPEPEVLGYLQLVGVDTLIIHRDEYDPADLAQLLSGLDALPQLRRRAEVGASLVYTLAPEPGVVLPPGALFVSNDERMPGLPVLGMIRRWEREGRALYGPGRLRFYGPLGAPGAGQVYPYALLAAGDEPATHGYAPAGLLWAGQGLVLYQRNPALLVSLSLAEPVAGQFHSRYPAALELRATPEGLRVGDTLVGWAAPPTALHVELDLVSLGAGTLQAGDDQLALPPGRSMVSLSLPANAPLRIKGGAGVAVQQLRALAAPEGAPSIVARSGLVAQAEASYADELLTVDVRGAGAPGVMLEVRGAAARDDRPVLLLAGVQPLPAEGGELRFAVRPLRPEAAWLTGGEAPQDGRYIVYIKDQANPDGPGRPVAKFNLRGGRLADFEPVPLPVTAVP